MKIISRLQKLLVVLTFTVSLTSAWGQVVFKGAIDRESVADFLEKNRDFQGTSITLSSHGGDGEVALRLADWILTKQLDVIVDTICFSACANYLFLAGKNKTVLPGALLMWHGAMLQKNVRDSQNRFRGIDAIVAAAGFDALAAEDRDFFNLWKERFAITNLLQAKELIFLNRVGVNEYLLRLGQEPVNYQPNCWGVSEPLLRHLGVRNLSVDRSYSSIERFSNSGLAIFLCQSRPQFFDLTKDGRIANVAN
jgi:hypothetical protein